MKWIKQKPRKPLTLLASVLAVALIAAGGTMAWLFVLTDTKVNTFQPATVTGTIVEEFDQDTKRNVKVRNDGTTDVYIRVALVPTWLDEDGNILAESADETNLSFSLNSADWFKSGEYYYHRAKVSPDQTTGILASSIKPIGGPAGAKMNLQVLSEVIQASPERAVQQAWARTVDADGKLS